VQEKTPQNKTKKCDFKKHTLWNCAVNWPVWTSIHIWWPPLIPGRLSLYVATMYKQGRL